MHCDKSSITACGFCVEAMRIALANRQPHCTVRAGATERRVTGFSVALVLSLGGVSFSIFFLRAIKRDPEFGCAQVSHLL